MFERYTDPAKRVLFFARYEASEFGSLSIDPEHLLLGLLREPAGLVRQLLSTPPASVDAVIAETKRRMHAREKFSTSVEIPLSGSAKLALTYAAEEADRLLHDQIRPVHLLVGLLREEGTVAASVLQAHGVVLDDVRPRIVAQMEDTGDPDPRLGLIGAIITLVGQFAEARDAAERQALRARLNVLLDGLERLNAT